MLQLTTRFSSNSTNHCEKKKFHIKQVSGSVDDCLWNEVGSTNFN